MSKAAGQSRREANLQNAAKSTGPRTEQGKQRSSRNALSHGLASAAVVLPCEDASEYEKLRTAFEDQYHPGSELERELLGRMVDCWWRLKRAHRVEAQFLTQRAEAGTQLEGDAALAALFSDPVEMARMRLMMRYISAAERAWQRALADFNNIQQSRLASEQAGSGAECSPELEDLLVARMERYLNAPIPGPEYYPSAAVAAVTPETRSLPVPHRSGPGAV